MITVAKDRTGRPLRFWDDIVFMREDHVTGGWIDEVLAADTVRIGFYIDGGPCTKTVASNSLTRWGC